MATLSAEAARVNAGYASMFRGLMGDHGDGDNELAAMMAGGFIMGLRTAHMHRDYAERVLDLLVEVAGDYALHLVEVLPGVIPVDDSNNLTPR
ncbi:MAG: hypothetical protein IIB33_04090 [Chloroflexi bacterium]|nr:hypothetical protein [Chloroflexota bacterium]